MYFKETLMYKEIYNSHQKAAPIRTNTCTHGVSIFLPNSIPFEKMHGKNFSKSLTWLLRLIYSKMFIFYCQDI